MARPTRVGLGYFPMDVGFLRDKKVRLLRAEFGASSVLFVLYVLSKAYEEDGYFLQWDDDERGFAAEELGESTTYISEVLQGCLKRSLFDQRVFQMFGILTSAGIQRRYLRGCEKRAEIAIVEEYWLLNLDDKKDVPASIRAKLTFFSVTGGNNRVNSPENLVNSGRNPQSKEEKRKVKYRKVEESISAPSSEEILSFYLATYQALCKDLPLYQEVTEKGKAGIQEFEKRLGREQFPEVCRKANASSFCRGGKGWKADFDFLVRPEKAAMVLAGKYDDRPPCGEEANPYSTDIDRAKQEMDWLDQYLEGGA